jgi:hypothetical protein
MITARDGAGSKAAAVAKIKRTHLPPSSCISTGRCDDGRAGIGVGGRFSATDTSSVVDAGLVVRRELVVEMDYGHFSLFAGEVDPEPGSGIDVDELDEVGIVQVAGAIVVASPHQNMRYTRRDDAWLTRCAWGWPFGRGSGQPAIDILIGMYRGRPAACLTCRYTARRQGGGEDGGQIDRHYFGLFSVQLRHPVPELRVAKQLFGYRRQLAQTGFAATFEVRGADAAFSAQVLHPEMQRFLLTNDLGGFSVVDDRIFIRTRGRVDPDPVEHYLDVLITVIEHTPDAVGLG